MQNRSRIVTYIIYFSHTLILTLFLITELLSYYKKLDRQHLLSTWKMVGLILFVFVILIVALKRKQIFHVCKSLLCFIKEYLISGKQQDRNLFIYHTLLPLITKTLVFIALVIGAKHLLDLSIISVPYNYDSMTYHLPRVIHWVQNASVNHFATPDVRHIASPPLCEYIFLQLYLIKWYDDSLFCAVQMCFFILDIAIVMLVTKRLLNEENVVGFANLAWCIFAGLLFLSLPIAFAESFNTQNDIVAAFFQLTFVWFTLDMLQLLDTDTTSHSFQQYLLVFFMGINIGLGYVTKPNTLFTFIGMLAWILHRWIKNNKKVIPAVLLSLTALVPITTITLPGIVRNLLTFSDLSPKQIGTRQLIGTINPIYIITNLLKNLLFLMGNGLVSVYSQYGQKFVGLLSHILGIDINAEVISEDGRLYTIFDYTSYSHDTATAPIFTIIILLILVACLYKFLSFRKCCINYTFVSITSLLIFLSCLRWEPYISRYTIGFYAICCPAVVLFFSSYIANKGITRIFSYVLLALVTTLSVLNLLSMYKYHTGIISNQDSSWRQFAYYTNHESTSSSQMQASDFICENGLRFVGVIGGGNYWYYPLYQNTRISKPDVEFEFLFVDNESNKYTNMSFVPEIILVCMSDKNWGECIQYNNFEYHISLDCGDGLLIYSKL